MQGGRKEKRKAMYVRTFIASVLILGALLYWPRFDLVVMIWGCAVLFFINDQIDEQLADQPQVTSQNNQLEVDDGYYYKEVIQPEKQLSFGLAIAPLYLLIGLPKRSEPWELMNVGMMTFFFGMLLFRYFYLKYFDAVKEDTLPKNTRKKSRHFLYFDETVLREIKGRKQWQIQLDQITAIDLHENGGWIFYRDQGQIKQHSIHLLQWEKLPELRQKLRVVEQRLKPASQNPID